MSAKKFEGIEIVENPDMPQDSFALVGVDVGKGADHADQYTSPDAFPCGRSL